MTETAVLFVDPVTQKLHDSTETAANVLCYYLCDENDYGKLPPHAAVKVKDINQIGDGDTMDVMQTIDLMRGFGGTNLISVKSIYQQYANQLARRTRWDCD